jgi:hypothetical protein
MARSYHPAELVTRPRVFARPRTFDVECPFCGTVFLVRSGSKPKAKRQAGIPVWDPLSSELHCSWCNRWWTVGLVLWQVGKRRLRRPGLPRDQVPDREELAQIRQQTGALVIGDVAPRDNLGRVTLTNLVPECCCGRMDPPQQYTRLWNPQCPIHDS